MKQILFICTICTLILTAALCSTAQPSKDLRREIQRIVSSKNAVVGVSISGSDRREILSVNGDRRFPMQSVFKFHIALAVLSEIDRDNLSFEQTIKIEKKDLLPNLYSPIRDAHPEGASLTIAEILEYTVSRSDNVGCEVLLKLLGGPAAVEKYFVVNKFKDVSIKFNEEQQQSDWNLQFQNWTTPKAANTVLAAFYSNRKKPLAPKSYDFIWKVMKETTTGTNRLKGALPRETVVAHKTGSSGINGEGLTAAVNDIGIVFLPGGQYYYISVFVTDSKEDAATNEKIIADISKAVWNYFTDKR